ncbi:MAG TPA: GNAT family protein [Acidimicrobiales bacterium]|jgi:RimJ/RimL family protein N-acetyltransferase|nr:GNAT family protein [Acidimicrobiales bacterium]
METGLVVVRPAVEADFDAWFAIFRAVAAEGRWIGRELPIDKEEQRERFVAAFLDGDEPDQLALALLAEVDGQAVGHLGLRSRRGLGDLGMAVLEGWRGRGVGAALMAAAVDWARVQGLHKVSLQLWPHNVAALRLYQKFGFQEEGRLVRQYRRRNGELWDAIVMGLVLDTTSPSSPYAEPGGATSPGAEASADSAAGSTDS